MIRNTRPPIYCMGRCKRVLRSWLLYSWLNPISHMASSVSCFIRGTRNAFVWLWSNFNNVQHILWSHAQNIAAAYPPSRSAEYQAAAVGFRIPYWDWASNPMMPAAVSKVTINVTTPTGPRMIANPLYNYTFHPQPSAAEFPPNDLVSLFPPRLVLLSSIKSVSPHCLGCGTCLRSTPLTIASRCRLTTAR